MKTYRQHIAELYAKRDGETSQARLNRLMQDAANRTPVGTKNARGGVWNGDVWVYGR